MGTFDPLPNIYGEQLCSLNIDRINYWVKEGVQISSGAGKLLGKLFYKLSLIILLHVLLKIIHQCIEFNI